MLKAPLNERARTTLQALLATCVITTAAALLPLLGDSPINNFTPQGAMKADLNAGGRSITNAATIQATNVTVSGTLTPPTGFFATNNAVTSLGPNAMDTVHTGAVSMTLTGGVLDFPYPVDTAGGPLFLDLGGDADLPDGSLIFIGATGFAFGTDEGGGLFVQTAYQSGELFDAEFNPEFPANFEGSALTTDSGNVYTDGSGDLFALSVDASQIEAGNLISDGAFSSDGGQFFSDGEGDVQMNQQLEFFNTGTGESFSLFIDSQGCLSADTNYQEGELFNQDLVPQWEDPSVYNVEYIPVNTPGGLVALNDGGVIVDASAIGSIDPEDRVLLDTSGDPIAGIIAQTGDGSPWRSAVPTDLPPLIGAAPASVTSTGTAGEIAYDSGYVYVCIATNTWKRAALSSW
jgi:hypothetical protein